MSKLYPCENYDCEFQSTLAQNKHCDAEDSCGGYYTKYDDEDDEEKERQAKDDV